MSNNNNNNNNLNNNNNNNGFFNRIFDGNSNNNASGTFNLGVMKNEWILSIIFGVLFFFIAMPYVYGFTNKFVTMLGFSSFLDENGAPSNWGIFFHALVAVLVSFLSIKVLVHFYPNGTENSASF